MRDYHNRKSIMLNSPRKVHRFPLVFVLFDKVGKRNMSGNHGYLQQHENQNITSWPQ